MTTINRDDGTKNVISGGSSGLVELLPSGNVRKTAYPDPDLREQNLRDLECEFQIYYRLPKHDRLLRMIDYSPEYGLVLEHMPAGTLRQRLRQSIEIDPAQRLQWACDAAEALGILHSNGIVHCDVKPENFLLDSVSRLKVIDFAGSSIDGSWASAFESTRFALPRDIQEPSTAVTDLFALGSTIYEIMTNRQPYEDLSDEEVEERYRQQVFPDINSLPCREVIRSCWRCEIKSAYKAMALITDEMELIRRGEDLSTAADRESVVKEG